MHVSKESEDPDVVWWRIEEGAESGSISNRLRDWEAQSFTANQIQTSAMSSEERLLVVNSDVVLSLRVLLRSSLNLLFIDISLL